MPIKTCACGRSFTAETWATLKPAGRKDGVMLWAGLELRDCVCRSTLSRRIPFVSADPADYAGGGRFDV
jgi:hypothetical protein